MQSYKSYHFGNEEKIQIQVESEIKGKATGWTG